jgi:hypothetical protein
VVKNVVVKVVKECVLKAVIVLKEERNMEDALVIAPHVNVTLEKEEQRKNAEKKELRGEEEEQRERRGERAANIITKEVVLGIKIIR